jgi:hypothetical protein
MNIDPCAWVDRWQVINPPKESSGIDKSANEPLTSFGIGFQIVHSMPPFSHTKTSDKIFIWMEKLHTCIFCENYVLLHVRIWCRNGRNIAHVKVVRGCMLRSLTLLGNRRITVGVNYNSRFFVGTFCTSRSSKNPGEKSSVFIVIEI